MFLKNKRNEQTEKRIGMKKGVHIDALELLVTAVGETEVADEALRMEQRCQSS